MQILTTVLKRKGFNNDSIIKRAYSNAFVSCLGNTDLVRLTRASEITGCNILGKCEFQNPGGTVKDRAAWWMIKDAINRGELIPGKPGIVVEGTAGNTGIGLGLAAMPFGFTTIICIPNTQSQEKKNILRWAGCYLVEFPAVPFSNPNHYVHAAERIATALREEKKVACVYANQWDNLMNRQSHVESTGPELWRQTNYRLDAFSCAAGTGGTVSGVAKYLRSVNPKIKIGLTDPKGASLVNYFNDGVLRSEGSSISEGIGQGRITGNLQNFAPDYAMEVSDIEMMNALEDLQRYDGLCMGMSSGINVAGAIKLAKILGPGHTIATILCDVGSRYSAKLYNAPFLHSKGLPVFPWLEKSIQDEKFAQLNLPSIIENAKTKN